MAERAVLPAIVTLDPVEIDGGEGGDVLRVRVTLPLDAPGRLPVILFSHGMMLGRSHYAALTDWWARAGFVVLQPDHADAAVDGFAAPMPLPPDLWRRRIEDMHRLLRSLDRIERAAPFLHGRFDPHTVLAAGHSFGAHTCAALVGARVWDEGAGSGGHFADFAEPSVRGALLMSPPGSGGADLSAAFRPNGGFFTVDWDAISRPVLTIVGANDDSREMTIRDADWRADIYHRSAVPDMGLMTLEGAGHYLGGIVDPRRKGVEEAQPAFLETVREASLAFFRAVIDGGTLADLHATMTGRPASFVCR